MTQSSIFNFFFSCPRGPIHDSFAKFGADIFEKGKRPVEDFALGWIDHHRPLLYFITLADQERLTLRVVTWGRSSALPVPWVLFPLPPDLGHLH